MRFEFAGIYESRREKVLASPARATAGEVVQ